MIQFFRNMFTSKLGVIIAMLFVGLIALAFAMGDINAPSSMFSSGGQSVASVNGEDVDEEQITQMMNRALQNARQQNPGIDMGAFIEGGGLDQAIDQYVQGFALGLFAEDHGILISKRLIDAAIAEVPVFQGLTGEFDETIFRQVLAQQNLTEAEVRQDLTRQTLGRLILGPVTAATFVPEAVARPFAALLVEERRGQVGAIPSAAMPQGDPPTAAEINSFYQSHLRQYTLPERRAVRYAQFTLEQIAVPEPTEEQIRAYYREHSDEYAGRETRSFRQVILPSEDQARAFYNEVRGGTDFTAAAAERGFTGSATQVASTTQAALARETSQAVATAAFAAANGALVEPVRSGLGWHVLRVTGVDRQAGRQLGQVRPEIRQALNEQLANEALANFYLEIENAIDDGASFEEIAEDKNLTIVATPPLAPNGTAPGQPSFRGTEDLNPILQAAFTMSEGEDPVVVPLEENRRYALVDVTQILRTAPQELSAIRTLVARDFVLDRAARRARRIADRIVEQVNGGMPLAQALQAADVDLPPPQPARATRQGISRAQNVPEPIRLMFRMAVNTAKIVRLPRNQGWFVVVLEAIESDTDLITPEVVAATQRQFAEVTANEYAEQFMNAMLADYEVERDEDAIAALTARLTGGR